MEKTDTIKLLQECDAGSKMAVTSLYKYMNQYKAAEEPAKDICRRLIAIEEELRDKLRKFL